MGEEPAQKKLDVFSDPTVLLSVTSLSPKAAYMQNERIRVGPERARIEKFIGELEHMEIETEVQEMTGEPKSEIGEFQLDKIYCEDCVEGMKKLPDKSVDLVIADPPYNLSKGNIWLWDRSVKLKGFGGPWKKTMEKWDNMSLSEYWDFTEVWLTETKRVLKPTGSIWVYGTYHNIGIINTLFQILGIEIINEIIWFKRNAFPNLSGRRFTASHETLLWGHVGGRQRKYFFNYREIKDKYFPEDLLKKKGKQMRTVWDIPNNKTRDEIKFGTHPTQKPLKLCERIILASSKPNDLILIPFCGAGSECVAAKMLSRNFISFEIDHKYVDVAKKRLADLQSKFSKTLEIRDGK